MPNLHDELVAGLRAAAAGKFRPRFYRVRISPRRERRYRRPGRASLLTPEERRALQAFWLFGNCTITEVGRRFHRRRETVRHVLRDPAFQAYVEASTN